MNGSHNPYAWITTELIADWMRKKDETKAPRLTLITGNERMPTMTTPNEQAPSLAAVPLHKHGAFDEIQAAANLLALGADAIKGMGAMMLPEMEAGDEHLTATRRSDLSAIFSFFGEVLREPAGIISDAAERIQWAAQGKET